MCVSIVSGEAITPSFPGSVNGFIVLGLALIASQSERGQWPSLLATLHQGDPLFGRLWGAEGVGV